ncbi:MAG: (2Fe-2S)-binding protein [Eubacteriaceae bacterium]|nr:(2Fe-2S)-binding protein [Eubacteriaceae bacterium]
MKKIIKFKLNGDEYEEYAQTNMTMLDFLRKEMHLTGTKKGCEEGECGACTILLDGSAVDSCLMLAVEADGHEIVTIEGVQQNGVLHPVQKEFIDKWALQCGFCTPGMIMSALSLLHENPRPTEHEIRDAIAGNLCRCTGYAKIVEAIDSAAKILDKEANA